MWHPEVISYHPLGHPGPSPSAFITFLLYLSSFLTFNTFYKINIYIYRERERDIIYFLIFGPTCTDFPPGTHLTSDGTRLLLTQIFVTYTKSSQIIVKSMIIYDI
jgi:hypothetical protein